MTVSTYTTNLGIEKIATGAQSGQWGNTTNTNFDLIDQAVNSVQQVTLSAAGTSGSPNELQIRNGEASDGRNKFIEFIDGGDLGGTAYVQLTPDDAEKIVHIRNSLSGSRSIIIFQGTYNSSNDFIVANGADVLLKFDGAGASATVTDVNNSLHVNDLTVGGEFKSQGIQDFNPSSSDYRITISSTSEVGIGNSSPEDFTNDVLVIGDDTNTSTKATVVTSTSGTGSITFSDGSGGSNRDRGRIQYSHSGDSLSLYAQGYVNATFAASESDIEFSDPVASGFLPALKISTDVDLGLTGGLNMLSFYRGSTEKLRTIVEDGSSDLVKIENPADGGLRLSGGTSTGAELLLNGPNSTIITSSDILLNGGASISNFASTGIDDNATSTAITIDSSQEVGIGATAPQALFHARKNTAVVGELEVGRFEAFLTGPTNAQQILKILEDNRSGGGLTPYSRFESVFISGDGSTLDSGFEFGGNSAGSYLTIDSSGNTTISGDLTVGGVFASTGIDDNATSTQLTIGIDDAQFFNPVLPLSVGLTVGANTSIRGDLDCDGFTSTGIDDNAASTAITIDSSNDVYISGDLSISNVPPRITLRDLLAEDDKTFIDHSAGEFVITSQDGVTNGSIAFKGFNGTSLTNYMSIDSGGQVTIYGAINGAGITTTGTGNCGVGPSALDSLTSGVYNTSIGSNALTAVTSGGSNTAVGADAGIAITTGSINTAVGVDALRTLTTASKNVAIGQNALSQANSNNNTAIGTEAGDALTSGTNNTIIGYDSDATSASASNSVTLGNSSISVLRCQVTSITALSDARDKADVSPLAGASDFVRALNPVSFTWNMRDGGKVGVADQGFIAQELLQAQDESGYEVPGLVYEENPEKLEAAYGKLLPAVVKALQEALDRIESLESELSSLRS